MTPTTERKPWAIYSPRQRWTCLAVGLRYALMLVLILLLPGAWVMYLCGRQLPLDI